MTCRPDALADARRRVAVGASAHRRAARVRRRGPAARCSRSSTARSRPAPPATRRGTVRERVGAGGVVGLGAGRDRCARRRWPGTPPAPRCWPCPSHGGAAAVGPLPARPARLRHRGRGRAAVRRVAALAGLSYEDRLGLAAVAVPISLAPGAPGDARPAPDDALVLAAGGSSPRTVRSSAGAR